MVDLDLVKNVMEWWPGGSVTALPCHGREFMSASGESEEGAVPGAASEDS